MDIKDIKPEELRTARPDIAQRLIQEGAASRDEEVQALITEKQTLTTQMATLTAAKEGLEREKAALTEEKTKLQARVDEMNVLEVTRQKEAVVDTAFKDLPEQARTKLFREQCLSVPTSKDGFDAKVFEAKVLELVKDRKTLCESAGVRGMGGEQHRDGEAKTAKDIAESALSESK